MKIGVSELRTPARLLSIWVWDLANKKAGIAFPSTPVVKRDNICFFFTLLNADIQNAKIIVAHHAKYIQDNVPASAEVEEPKAEPKAEDDYGNPINK